MRKRMTNSFMAQCVSFVYGVHVKEVISAVRYPVQLVPMLARPSMCTLIL